MERRLRDVRRLGTAVTAAGAGGVIWSGFADGVPAPWAVAALMVGLVAAAVARYVEQASDGTADRLVAAAVVFVVLGAVSALWGTLASSADLIRYGIGAGVGGALVAFVTSGTRTAPR